MRMIGEGGMGEVGGGGELPGEVLAFLEREKSGGSRNFFRVRGVCVWGGGSVVLV
jgi:hypothetical protein